MFFAFEFPIFVFDLGIIFTDCKVPKVVTAEG